MSRMPGKNGDAAAAKTFLLNAAVLSYNFLQMKTPGLIWEIASCNLHFPTGRFQRPQNTSQL
jgi:hypothetical protein